MEIKTDTLIVGGGLAGISLAAQFAKRDHDFLLTEARDRPGGRILSEELGGGYFDLGPAWFWPGQPRMSALIERLGLRQFGQYARGELVFEDEHGRVQRGSGIASMQGSLRLKGGFGALITALSKEVPAAQTHFSTEIVALKRRHSGIIAQTHTGQTISAKRVVLALPPRLAAKLTFEPELSADIMRAMENIPTWMAGQAKAVAVYERPFWREAGLSGDAMSRYGPMVEIHDASPEPNSEPSREAGGPYGLFGFIGVPPKARSNQQILLSHIQDQLIRLFGPEAADPLALRIKDWAFDPFTAAALDHQPLLDHPRYGLPQSLSGLWEGRLVLSGSEIAPQFGGYLEGALEAAENTLLVPEP